MTNTKILKGLSPAQIKKYKKIKSILSKEVRVLSKYLIDASQGKLTKDLEAMWIEDANDIIRDYIEVLRDKHSPTFLRTFFYDRDTDQRELINDEAYDLASAIADGGEYL